MPTLKYNGMYWTRKGPGGVGEMTRGMEITVTDEWCAQYANRINDEFMLTGYEAHADEGNDGIPDPSWTVANIKKWLGDEGVEIGYGYKTKTVLLGMVEEHLNPSASEPLVEEVAEVAETQQENTME